MPITFRILGPLDADTEGGAVELGGRKQRAVLAALLLRAETVVPDERLIDDVWGEHPPATAAHTLEAYVSRLRRELAAHAVTLERRGGGYRLGLGGAILDARIFQELVDAAAQALALGEHDRAAAMAKDALDLWRGPVLAGTPLHLDARAEAEALEELRASALEIRIDADLELGRHAEIVGELRRVVHDSPYRQRLVAQLMVALYRSGRHAEALEVYERTRRALDADLGLVPSEELQRLAGQIVRQEPELRAPLAAAAKPEPAPLPSSPRLRTIALVGALAVAALALGVIVASGSRQTGSDSKRVALIRMWDPGGVGGQDEAGWTPFVEGLLAAERRHGLASEIVDLFPRRPPLGGFEPGAPADVQRLSRRLASERFDLVLWPLGLTGPNFYVVVDENPDTRFVFLDHCCVDDAHLRGARNATTISLRGDQAGHLAGYLSGLIEGRRRPQRRRSGQPVSVVTAEPSFPQEARWVDGFLAGAERALPGIDVRVDYSHEYDDQAICERIANEQIDAGSNIVFALAGDCGLGALSAAAVQGVWAIGGAEDRSHLGPHILASATKRYDRLTEVSVRWYLEGRLPRGEDVDLGLVDDAVALVGISPEVPRDIRSKVAREAARLRALEAAGSSEGGN